MWRYWRRRWRRRKIQSRFQPVVLITGCGSGVGWALAELLYDLPKFRVVVTARQSSVAKLQKRFVETDRFIIRALDITNEQDRIRLVDEVGRIWGGVNILVNNAGISYRAVLEHMSDEDEQAQFATNYFGPVGLIRLVLPHMRHLGRGKIINVSSVSGMLAMPTMSAYSASKHALEGASEALWYELKPLGVNVSLIQPGFINSQSFLKVRYTERSKPEVSAGGPYGDYYQNMTPFIARLMGLSFTTSEQVAEKILKVIRTENAPLWIPATVDAWFFYYLRRLLPRRIVLPLLFSLLPRVRHWGARYTRRRR